MNIDNFDFRTRPVFFVSLNSLDSLYNIHALNNSSKHCVLIVQPGTVYSRDKTE